MRELISKELMCNPVMFYCLYELSFSCRCLSSSEACISSIITRLKLGGSLKHSVKSSRRRCGSRQTWEERGGYHKWRELLRRFSRTILSCLLAWRTLLRPGKSIKKSYTSYTVCIYSYLLLNNLNLCCLSRSASADMIGRAKQCVQVLMDYSQLLFIVLVQDILKVLSWSVAKFFSIVCE